MQNIKKTLNSIIIFICYNNEDDIKNKNTMIVKNLLGKGSKVIRAKVGQF